MIDQTLMRIRDIIQHDIGNRGLRADPNDNLITACPNDFANACRSIAEHANPVIGILTGFYIPNAEPPAAETDGPLGALFLARAFVDLGFRVEVLVDESCRNAMLAGLAACRLEKEVAVLIVPTEAEAMQRFLKEGSTFWKHLTHLIAIERPGPSHHNDKYHNMAGIDITLHNGPAHLLVETVQRNRSETVSIGIGDGGNEIGMGKIPMETIRRNIAKGDVIACRVPTDYLIVCGVSNWGAYGLGAGVYLRKGIFPPADLFSTKIEKQLLDLMVKEGPLVDGVLGKQVAGVDGIPYEQYAAPIAELADIVISGIKLDE